MDNKSTPKISVIVPVYKVEQYLPKCIDSILAQTFTDFELLLIDDGSPDRSGEICDEYAAKDSRIRVFHKENGGVSSARNVGLDNANGEWIAFVDSDDWLENRYLDPILEIPEESRFDIIHFGYIYENKSGHQFNVIPFDKGSITLECFFTKHNFSSVSFSFIFKRALIEANNIRFNTTIKYSEDREFIIKNALISNGIFLSHSAQYHYVFNPSSAVNSKRSVTHISDDLQVINSIRLYTQNKIIKLEKTTESFIYSLLLNSFISALTKNQTSHIKYDRYINKFTYCLDTIPEVVFSKEDKFLFWMFIKQPQLICYYTKYKKIVFSFVIMNLKQIKRLLNHGTL